MTLIDGKEVSKIIKAEVKKQITDMMISPKLLVILVGDDPASKVYVSSKEKASKLCGINAETLVLDKDISEEELISIIKKANEDESVNAILVQLPLPKHIDSSKIVNAIDPLKDVDGLSLLNQGKLMAGERGIVPCTPKGVIKLLKYYNINLDGAKALVIGRSILVGKPVGMLLLNENASVTYAHSHTKDLKEACLNSDVIVVAIGKAKALKEDMVKEGAVIIDVGINRTDDGLVGDVDFENVKDKASFITPVPGGVGPMTIACLMENVLECYLMQKGK